MIKKRVKAFSCLWKIVTFALLLVNSIVGWTQATIKGDVRSPSESLPYANVLLLNEIDSSLVKGAVTTQDGLFNIDQVEPGDYIVLVSMIGFESTYLPILTVQTSAEYPLGEITLKRLETQLAAVDITARKLLYEQQIDRLIVNVEKSITSAGANALEVLSRIPGVTVNEFSKTISLNGSQGVSLMIDGKLTRLPLVALIDQLRATSAANIEKIEVYDTPPSEFEAGGNGGMINIILRKNEEFGTNGSFAMNLGYGKRFKYGASVNLNHRTTHANIYGSYNLSNRFSKSIYAFDRYVKQQGALVYTDARNERQEEFFSHNLRIGLDYDISDQTVIGGLLSGFIQNSYTEAINRSMFSRDDVPFSNVRNVNQEVLRVEHGMANFYIHHQLTEKEEIEFDIDYLAYQNESPSNYFRDFFDGNEVFLSSGTVSMDKSAPIENISLKLDYGKSFNENMQLKLGLKGTSSSFDNDIAVKDVFDSSERINEQFSQNYKLEERIGAAYSSLDIKLNDQTNVIFGLRYEFTDYLLSTQIDPVFLDMEFGNFFPSFFISQNLRERQQVQFSYSRRINRPAYNELAPFVTFIDPNTFFSGNPDLVPGISDNLSFSYRLNNLLFSVKYGRTQNAIYRYQPVIDPASNTQIYTTLNLEEEHLASLKISAPLKFTSWWESQNSLYGDWNQLVILKDAQESKREIKAMILSTTHTFSLKNNWVLETSGNYHSSSFYGLMRVKPKGAFNIGIQKKLPNDSGYLSLNMSDVFRTNIWQATTVIPALNLNNTSIFDVETRIIRLTYSSTFGSEKIKVARKRSTSSEEQRRRF